MEKIKNIILILVFYALGTFMPMGLLLFFAISPLLIDFFKSSSILFTLSVAIIFIPGVLFNSIILNRFLKSFNLKFCLYVLQCFLLSGFFLFIWFFPDPDKELNETFTFTKFYVQPFVSLACVIVIGAYLGSKDLIYRVIAHCFKVKKLTG